jgi:hypothetical protein
MVNFKKPRNRVEHEQETRLVNKMKANGWDCVKLHGNAYQKGLPDWLCWHYAYGFRLIEVKTKTGRLTPAQREFFLNKVIKKSYPVFVVNGPEDYNFIVAGFPNGAEYYHRGQEAIPKEKEKGLGL